MTILDRLNRRFGRFAIPHLTLFLIGGQILVFFMVAVGRIELVDVALIPGRILEGEFWRAFSFLFYPPIRGHPIFMAFAWYIFFLMGSALEHHWGDLRYNLFLFIAWIATLALSFLAPNAVMTNFFFMASVFLAFAFLNPSFELMLMFVLPVQVKWIAAVIWVFYGMALIGGGWPTKLAVAASTLNFFIFFGKDLVHTVKARQRRLAFEADTAAEKDEPVNRCHICGKSDRSHPDMEFRFCSQCEGHYCYCEEHLRAHEHVKSVDSTEE